MDDSAAGYQTSADPANAICGCQLCQAREQLAWNRQQASSYSYIPLLADVSHPSDGLYPIQNPSTADLGSEPHDLYDYLGYCSTSMSHQGGDDCCSSASPSVSEISAGFGGGLASPAAAAAAAATASSATLSSTAESEYPIAYFSDDGIAHMRLSKHIVLEVSDFAIRVVNNRNNSAVAVSSAATIGCIYHYNCRGWFDTSSQKVALTFDRDCDLLFRALNRPSIVRKGRDFYRMSQSSISLYAKEEHIFVAHDDQTHKRLLRRNSDENFQLRVQDMVKVSKFYRDSSDTINLDLCTVRAELHATGELRVWWTGPDGFVNQVIVAPTSGAFTLVTSTLEIVNTPKCEVTVKFGCLQISLGLRQLHLSNGSKQYQTDLYPMDTFGWVLPPDYYGMPAGPAPAFQHQPQPHQTGRQHHQHQHQQNNQQPYQPYQYEVEGPHWFTRQQQPRRSPELRPPHHSDHQSYYSSSSADNATVTTATLESEDDATSNAFSHHDGEEEVPGDSGASDCV